MEIVAYIVDQFGRSFKFILSKSNNNVYWAPYSGIIKPIITINRPYFFSGVSNGELYTMLGDQPFDEDEFKEALEKENK